MKQGAIPDEAFDEILKIIQMARLASKKAKLKPAAVSVEVEKVEPAAAEEAERKEPASPEMGEDEMLEELKKLLGG